MSSLRGLDIRCPTVGRRSCPTNERQSVKILDVPQSGSLAGQTSSHNRFGQYRRSRATPVNPNSSYQAAVRARMADFATEWRGLTATQRAGWAALGDSMTRTDGLGQTYTLTGLQAYASVNANRASAGYGSISDAIALEIPDPLTSISLTLTTAAFTVGYDPSPIGGSDRLLLYASKQVSAGKSYQSDVRLTAVSSFGVATPYDFKTEYEARHGALVLGNRIFVEVRIWKSGFVSAAVLKSAVVAAP